MTDIHPMNFKTIKLDICNMKYKNIYDLIVCINVLDDVYDFKKLSFFTSVGASSFFLVKKPLFLFF